MLLISRLFEISLEGGPQGMVQAIAYASMEAAERVFVQGASLAVTCCMVAHTVASVDRGFDATPHFHIVEVCRVREHALKTEASRMRPRRPHSPNSTRSSLRTRPRASPPRCA